MSLSNSCPAPRDNNNHLQISQRTNPDRHQRKKTQQNYLRISPSQTVHSDHTKCHRRYRSQRKITLKSKRSMSQTTKSILTSTMVARNLLHSCLSLRASNRSSPRLAIAHQPSRASLLGSKIIARHPNPKDQFSTVGTVPTTSLLPMIRNAQLRCLRIISSPCPATKKRWL